VCGQRDPKTRARRESGILEFDQLNCCRVFSQPSCVLEAVCGRGRVPDAGADPEGGGDEEDASPTSRWRIFSRYKYRQSLAYLKQRPMITALECGRVGLFRSATLLLATFTKCHLSLDGQLRRQTAITSSDYIDCRLSTHRTVSYT